MYSATKASASCRVLGIALRLGALSLDVACESAKRNMGVGSLPHLRNPGPVLLDRLYQKGCRARYLFVTRMAERKSWCAQGCVGKGDKTQAALGDFRCNVQSAQDGNTGAPHDKRFDHGDVVR